MRPVIMSLATLAFCLFALTDVHAKPTAKELENMLYLDLKSGRVVIKLRPDLAPNHVKRAKKLAREGFYDGLKFHRVIKGFMAQTGDPKGDGTGGSKYPDLKAEFNKEPYVRGTVGAARTNRPNTANSQFFITFQETSFLNGKYTVWGEVVRGMHLVDKIKKGKDGSGVVNNPDIIVKVQVAADAKDHSVMDKPDSKPLSGKEKRPGSF